MVTTSKSSPPPSRDDKQLPEYASKIREVVKACGPTHARFAKKIGRTRITVSRWVTGMREPGAGDYAALHRFAKDKSLGSADFFLSRAQAGNVSLEDKIKRHAALQHLEAIERDAAAGQPHSKGLLETAAGDPVKVRNLRYKQLKELGKQTTNGEFSLLASGILRDIATLEDIWLGRAVRAGKAAEAQRRQNKRLRASHKRHSSALGNLIAEEQEIFVLLIAKISSFLDELSRAIGGNWPSPPLFKQRILAVCDELSAGLRIIQWDAGRAKCASSILAVLDQAHRSANRTDDFEDLKETANSLYARLGRELAAMKSEE